LGKKFILFIIILLVFSSFVRAYDWNFGMEGVLKIKKIGFNFGLDTHKISAGLVFETKERIFVNMNLGGSWNLTSVDLGSRLLFRIAFGLGFKMKSHRLMIIWDHISNADLANRNPGRNALGVRYGYQF